MTDCWRILTEPVAFMGGHLKREFRLPASFAVFAGYLLVTLIATSIMFVKIQRSLPDFINEDIRKWNSLSFAMSAGAQIFGGFIFWFVGTGILACLSILMDGSGEYRKLLELTGYSQLPMLLFAFLGITFAITYTPGIRLERPRSASTEVMKEAFRKGIQEEFGQVKFKLLQSAKQCCNLWAIVLSVMALKYTNNLSWGKSVMSFFIFFAFYGLIEWMKWRFLLVPT